MSKADCVSKNNIYKRGENPEEIANVEALVTKWRELIGVPTIVGYIQAQSLPTGYWAINEDPKSKETCVIDACFAGTTLIEVAAWLQKELAAYDEYVKEQEIVTDAKKALRMLLATYAKAHAHNPDAETVEPLSEDDFRALVNSMKNV